MSNPTALSPGNSIVQIEGELEKLFAFQDKHLSKEKKAILVKEILDANLPIGAVIQGIRSLGAEELSQVRLATIMGSIRKFIIRGEEEARQCDHCQGGYLVMRDEQGRSFALACRCPAGDARGQANRLVYWKGQPHQMSNGRPLSIV